MNTKRPWGKEFIGMVAGWLPPPHLPRVGDTVVFNDHGLETCFGSSGGPLNLLKQKRMKVTRIEPESSTFPEWTSVMEVDDPDVNQFMLTNHDFDVVERAKQ